ncbi:S8 family serine peptidase [candidate division KSB1 bacterium]|nr:S8 family serine peptidase [candidate division KSB1 bacterium]
MITAQTIDQAFSALSQTEIAKLDPRFQKIIVGEYTQKEKILSGTGIETVGINSAGDNIYDAVVYTTNPEELVSTGIPVNTILPQFVTVRVTMRELLTLAQLQNVQYIDPGLLQYPLNDVTEGVTGADLLHAGYLNGTVYKGQDVILCIIDTGIDWEHKDFRDPADDTQSRILYIWDQTLTPQGAESSPAETDLNYGVEYTRAHIEDEIDGSPAGFVREQDTNGHGTHVTGTAAGNGASFTNLKYAGMAPQADIIVVKAGNGSFTESNIINALTYAQEKATAFGKSVVVNMSLGSNAGPHDGTDAKSQAIDTFTGSGRIVVVSAGNSGDDLIHTMGGVGAGNSVEITFTVPDYTPAGDVNNDDLSIDIWFDGNNDMTAQVISPNGYSVSQTSGGWVENSTNDGTVKIENYVFLSNSDRYIRVNIWDDIAILPPAEGIWKLKLTNNSGANVNYHGWLFDQSIGTAPSIISLSNSDSHYTLSNSAVSAIIVGSYVHRWYWPDYLNNYWWGGSPDLSDNLSSFSSRGPTRDEQDRPDIVAPGDKIVSSLSQYANPGTSAILPGQKHQTMQGTSMSSPVVAGAVALLLQENSNLDDGDVKSLMIDNADTDSYTGLVWNSMWGNGKLNIFGAMSDAMGTSPIVAWETMIYDQWGANSYMDIGSAGFQKIAVKFTPSLSGIVSGFFFQTYINNTLTAPLNVEVWSDNSGKPGTKLSGSSTIAIEKDKILKNSNTFVNLLAGNIFVNSGTNYHIVMYPSNTGEVISISVENNVSSDNRSTYFNSSNWYSLSTDFRIRPVVVENAGLKLLVKVMLQGPFNSVDRTMDTNLTLPLTSPYSEDPVTIASMPENIVDWVLVQLRTTTTGTAIVSKSGLLQSDGKVVSADGRLYIELKAPAGDYYVVVKHRNHLSVMSNDPYNLDSASPVTCDLIHGDGSHIHGTNGAIELLTGLNVWGMWSGDVNKTGIIDGDDRNATWNNRTLTGYQMSDCDLNGRVGASDRNLTWNNRTIQTQVP